jgi:hypothetical protein
MMATTGALLVLLASVLVSLEALRPAAVLFTLGLWIIGHTM